MLMEMSLRELQEFAQFFLKNRQQLGQYSYTKKREIIF